MDDSVPHLRGMQWCRCTRSVLKLCAHDLWYETFCPAHSGLRWCRCARSVLQKSKSNHKTCMKRSCCLEKLFLYFWTKWLCFFREWFVSFKNRSLPCSRVQTGTRCGLVAAPNLHPPKISPKCSEKKVNETIVTQNCSCRFMSNGWKCWNWLACDIVDKWLKHGHGENVSSWQIFEMLKLPPQKKTRSPIRRPSPIFHPQMRPKNCCKSLATSKFGKLLKMLKWVGMRNCWQMVEKWTWRKSWNWLTCEIVDKSLKCENDTRNVLSLQPRTKSWPGLLA